MIVMLQTQGLKSLDDLRAFLAGSQRVEIRTCEREACCAVVGQTLNCFGYGRIGKAVAADLKLA
jgi:phosphoglycerate dehydrogenase-like enzyme